MSRPGQPRNWTKAEVRFETRAGKAVVVKDFRARPWWIRRFIGRPALHREATIYRHLIGLTGIPRLFGFEGPECLVIERVAGRPLPEVPLGSLPETFFDALELLIEAVHSRGVALADLHRSNVLVDAIPAPHLVDFALARVARGTHPPGPFLRTLFRLDRFAAARIRARHFGRPDPRPTGFLGLLYRAVRTLKP